MAGQGRQELAPAAESLLAGLFRDQARDDATAILMRDETCPQAVRAVAVRALAVDGGLPSSGICGHLLITTVIGEMLRVAAAAEADAVLRLLEALAKVGLKPGRWEAMRVVEAFVDDGRPETVRIYRRVMEWVGRCQVRTAVPGTRRAGAHQI